MIVYSHTASTSAHSIWRKYTTAKWAGKGTRTSSNLYTLHIANAYEAAVYSLGQFYLLKFITRSVGKWGWRTRWCLILRVLHRPTQENVWQQQCMESIQRHQPIAAPFYVQWSIADGWFEIDVYKWSNRSLFKIIFYASDRIKWPAHLQHYVPFVTDFAAEQFRPYQPNVHIHGQCLWLPEWE